MENFTKNNQYQFISNKELKEISGGKGGGLYGIIGAVVVDGINHWDTIKKGVADGYNSYKNNNK